MNIVIPSFGLGPTGGDRVLTSLANGLSKRGHTVAFVNLNTRTPHFPISKRVKMISVPIRKMTPKTPQQVVLRICEGMAKIASALPPADIYLANWVYTVTPCISRYQDGTTVFLAQANEIDIAKTSASMIRQGMTAQAYLSKIPRVTPSHYLQHLFQQTFGTPSTIIPPGIDLHVFKPKPKTNRITQILFSGDITSSNKGFDLLIEALTIIHRRNPRMRFQLNVATQKTPPAHATYSFPCRFVRPKNDDALVRQYQSADIFCSLSRAEGFGLSPLEAMACGAAAVVTDSGGIRSFATDGSNCIYVTRNAKSIADGIERLIADAMLRKQLAANGIATARQYSEKQMVDAFERYFKRLLTKK